VDANELRRLFLEFYEARGHKICPSDSLVPANDPTILFTPAGMNQFKDQFRGKGVTFRRAATCQKCLRTDDIDKVGHTPGHHTFFEMLGNFSFGDYFKEEAILWGWEFLIEELKIDSERLSASVYEKDEEALRIWVDKVGLPEEKVRLLDASENFWPPNAQTEGPNGVCGPCSEIFFDVGPEAGDDRLVELYNLVFTQFNRADGGVLEPLPSSNIDTGMGFERTLAVLQGVKTDFEASLFVPIIDEICRLTKKKYNPAKKTALRFRRIADHVRAVVFCIGDGILPSNQGRGYVVRRLLRRAVMDGRELGMAEENFLYGLVATITEVMAEPYPELAGRRENIAHIIRAEEESFQATLAQGLPRLHEMLDEAVASGMGALSGDDAFLLHDTYGIPVDIVSAESAARGLDFEKMRSGFDKLLELQRDHSRKKTKLVGDIFGGGVLAELKDKLGATEFLGYGAREAKGKLVAIIKGEESKSSAGTEDGEVELLFDRTPFYGEAGGQVGDTGEITGKGAEAEVRGAQRVEGLIVHRSKVTEGKMKVGKEYELKADEGRRQAIARAHTATHLLHRALREILGEHAEQAGSLVAPDRLRFDFPHPQRVEQKELREIERLVNGWVLDNRPLGTYESNYEKAREEGVVALFGEKYGDEVRVVEVAGLSKELCGGTHAKATGDIGSFLIVSEGSIGAGVRRIEAVVGELAVGRMNDLRGEMSDACYLLKCPEGRLRERLDEVLAEVRELRREVTRLKQAGPKSALGDLEEATEMVGDVKVAIAGFEDMGMDELRALVDKLRGKEKTVAVLGSRSKGRAHIVCGLSKDMVAGGLDAAELVREVAKEVDGGGGGRKDMAQAGGGKPEGLERALERAREVVKERLAKRGGD